MTEPTVVPMLEFVDCSPDQISARIDKMMRGRLAQLVAVRTKAEESIVGTYESVDEIEIMLEVDQQTQRVVRIPTAEISMFGLYVPPLDRSDDLRGEAW